MLFVFTRCCTVRVLLRSLRDDESATVTGICQNVVFSMFFFGSGHLNQTQAVSFGRA